MGQVLEGLSGFELVMVAGKHVSTCFSQAQRSIFGDDDVIDYLDPEKFARAFESLGHLAILTTGCWITRGMVMYQ